MFHLTKECMNNFKPGTCVCESNRSNYYCFIVCVCVGFEILVLEKLLYVDTWNNLLPIPACGKKSIILIIVIIKTPGLILSCIDGMFLSTVL